ncbi:MAG: hypothetical protein WC272_06010 [Sulfurimonas sp.]
MQEMKHKLSYYQLKVIDRVKKQNQSEDKGNFLILEQSKQKFIFEADITPASKLLLIYFLSKLDFNHRHLYIHASYKIIEKVAICVVIVFSMFFKNFSSSSFSADKKSPFLLFVRINIFL